MSTYKNILLATDLTESSHKVVEHAKTLARDQNAALSIVHVVEYVPSYPYVYIAVEDIEGELVAAAREKLVSLAAELGIPAERQFIGVGAAKLLILETAETSGIDLIVVGSHGRHGLSRILGSTANAVINSAHCDVLTVRFKD